MSERQGNESFVVFKTTRQTKKPEQSPSKGASRGRSLLSQSLAKAGGSSSQSQNAGGGLRSQLARAFQRTSGSNAGSNNDNGGTSNYVGSVGGLSEPSLDFNMLSQSCPSFTVIPPPRPRRQPSRPMKDPPRIKLPPSPPESRNPLATNESPSEQRNGRLAVASPFGEQPVSTSNSGQESRGAVPRKIAGAGGSRGRSASVAFPNKSAGGSGTGEQYWRVGPQSYAVSFCPIVAKPKGGAQQRTRANSFVEPLPRELVGRAKQVGSLRSMGMELRGPRPFVGKVSNKSSKSTEGEYDSDSEQSLHDSEDDEVPVMGSYVGPVMVGGGIPKRGSGSSGDVSRGASPEVKLGSTPTVLSFLQDSPLTQLTKTSRRGPSKTTPVKPSSRSTIHDKAFHLAVSSTAGPATSSPPAPAGDGLNAPQLTQQSSEHSIGSVNSQGFDGGDEELPFALD